MPHSFSASSPLWPPFSPAYLSGGYAAVWVRARFYVVHMSTLRRSMGGIACKVDDEGRGYREKDNWNRGETEKEEKKRRRKRRGKNHHGTRQRQGGQTKGKQGGGLGPRSFECSHPYPLSKQPYTLDPGHWPQI